MKTFILPDILPGYKTSSLYHYYQYKSDETNSRSQIHFTTHCISLVFDGVKHLRSTEGMETFTKGAVLLFSPGNYVSYEIKENNGTPYKSALLFFSSALIQEFFSQVGKENTMASDKSGLQYLSFHENEYLLHYSETVRELLEGDKFSGPLQKIKILELLAYLHAQDSTCVSGLLNHSQIPPSDASRIKVIENNIYSDLTLSDLAFLCNMSLSTFKRWFEKQYGESPGKLLKQKRLEQAANQIKLLRKNPTEIFSEAGYADYSSFSHSFKKQFGVCPKEYRQQTV